MCVYYLYHIQAQELLAQQSLENSSMGQCYSTNYNKLLNAITVNRALGNSRRAHGKRSVSLIAAIVGLNPVHRAR